MQVDPGTPAVAPLNRLGPAIGFSESRGANSRKTNQLRVVSSRPLELACAARIPRLFCRMRSYTLGTGATSRLLEVHLHSRIPRKYRQTIGPIIIIMLIGSGGVSSIEMNEIPNTAIRHFSMNT